MFKRSLYHTLLSRLREPRRFIQALAGPRQVGKTTLARQVLQDLPIPAHYASADEPTLRDRAWLEQQWDLGRLRARQTQEAVLVLDEIQKIPDGSAVVKRLWDEDAASGIPLKVALLGSSPLLLQRGLSESLAGRFEVIPVPHWSFAEMRDAFGWTLEQFVYFGGYPGAAALVDDPPRWSRYIVDSLIETALSRDILLMTRVDKPALLRRLFQLGCDYSGQILSYQKMLGQLQDAGNTTTLAHYLDLLSGAGMLTGLPKYSGERVRQRASSPKLQMLNTALMTAQSPYSFETAQNDRDLWGRLIESAVGAHLLNTAAGAQVQVFLLLAGPEPGGGLCPALRGRPHGPGGQERASKRGPARPGGILQGGQAPSQAAGRRPGNPGRGVPAEAGLRMGRPLTADLLTLDFGLRIYFNNNIFRVSANPPLISR